MNQRGWWIVVLLLVYSMMIVLAPVFAQAGPGVQPFQQTKQVGDLTITVTTTPATGDQGVMVQVRDGQGQPVDNATVTAGVQMQGMPMAGTPAAFIPAQAGRYDGRIAFSMVGGWDLVITVTPQGGAPVQATYEVTTVAATPLPLRPSAQPLSIWSPWTLIGVGLLALGIVVGVVTQWGLRQHRSLGFAGSWLLLLAGVGLWIGPTYQRVTLGSAGSAAAAVKRAQPLFVQNCQPCHGATGQGDGPAARTLNPRPANLTAPHLDMHPDGQIYAWIHDGFPGSAMPAFGQRLTSDQIWDLVDYVRHFRPQATATPTP